MIKELVQHYLQTVALTWITAKILVLLTVAILMLRQLVLKCVIIALLNGLNGLNGPNVRLRARVLALLPDHVIAMAKTASEKVKNRKNAKDLNIVSVNGPTTPHVN